MTTPTALALIVAVAAAVCSSQAVAQNADPTRVLGSGHANGAGGDARFLPANVRTLHQGSGLRPYEDKAQWLARAAQIRQQILVAAGLWPLPQRQPLSAVIHGRIDRDDYTIEKVYFESYPGFFVSGNLYRPKGKPGPFPGVLCPHGHWKEGRFNETDAASIQKQLAGGWEKSDVGARYVLQARCANLAKLGCVVFHYDMVGYADSDPERFPHRKTFLTADDELHGLGVFGLQLWDSIRSLDFLESLPDVDKSRLACTGASGGATQTFTLMAVDDRLAAAAPVCMISAGEHQGGCVCENTALLRIGTDNVEIAAAFAPKPFIHPTATGDWTKAFMEQGYPEIQATYRLFGAQEDMQAFRQDAGHNYNRTSREAVYNFFNKHLRLGHAGVLKEQPFVPVAPKDLSVWDAQHPRPVTSDDGLGLRNYLIASALSDMESMLPTNAASLAKARQILLPALRHMTATSLPRAGDLEANLVGEATEVMDGAKLEKSLLQRKGDVQALPVVTVIPPKPSGIVTVLVMPDGKQKCFGPTGTPAPILRALVPAGHVVIAPDLCQIGELAMPAGKGGNPDSEFFTGYNRTVFANRVHDVLTTIAWAKSRPGATRVNLIGLGRSGPWVLLASALAGDAVHRTLADANSFDFEKVKDRADEYFLPCSLRYGGIWPLASMAAPGEVFVYNTGLPSTPAWLRAAYDAAGAADHLMVMPTAKLPGMVEWITRKAD